MKKKLSHLDSAGRARMVDVGAKPISARSATAEGFVRVSRETIELISRGGVPKGDVLSVARVAAIMAAKKTGEIIPLCHPLGVESVEISFDLPRRGTDIRITATARISAKTGVEMEALTAVAVAALTIYDMCKAVDKGMEIHGIRLLEKTK
jgi:cyclic pyranopterin monophosphate synthase